MLLVCNKGDETLGVIDVEAGRQVATVPLGGTTGHEVAASPDGRTAYVPLYGNALLDEPGSDGDSLVVIDLASRQVTGTVDFGKGVRPHLPAVRHHDGLVYVTMELDDAVAVVDPGSLKVVGRIPTGQEQSHMLAISRDGQRGYTANIGAGTVSMLNLDGRTLDAVIPVCGSVQRICLSVDDRLVFTSDQRSPRLAVLDATTGHVRAWVTLPGRGYGSAPTPDGRWLLVNLRAESQVAVVDLERMQVVKTVDVPDRPASVVVRPDGLEAYISCDVSHQIAVLDTALWTLRGTIAAGSGADGLTWVAGGD